MLRREGSRMKRISSRRKVMDNNKGKVLERRGEHGREGNRGDSREGREKKVAKVTTGNGE